MGISRGFFCAMTEYLHSAKSPMAVIGDQDVRISKREVEICVRTRSRIITWGSSLFDRSGRLSREQLFNVFGVDEIECFDLYGAPDIKEDLSLPIKIKYKCKYNSVLEIGTIEHVINPYQALLNIDDMLNVGGVVMHFSPIRIPVNHGYYSISPQLLFDFYLSENRYKLMKSELVIQFFGYESFMSLVFRLPYSIDQDMKSYREIGLIKAVLRKVRRVLVALSSSTYLGFVAVKNKEENNRGEIVQHQFVN